MTIASQTASAPMDLGEDIESLDFSMVKLKLQDSEEGPGWSVEECDAVEVEYRRFLALKRAYPLLEIVPTRSVDVFWHQHILDTVMYAQDCMNVFGHFVHHYPYFGMGGTDDYNDLLWAFDLTQELYKRHFGDTSSDSLSMAKCRTKCKPVKCK